MSEKILFYSNEYVDEDFEFINEQEDTDLKNCKAILGG